MPWNTYVRKLFESEQPQLVLTMDPRRPLRHQSLFLLIAFASLSFVVFSGAFAQTAASPFRAGEHLEYKVKWAFVRLGTVTVRQEPADSASGVSSRVHVDGESAAGLPFIDVLFRSSSLLNPVNPASVLYELESGRDVHERTVYIADTTHRRMFALETKGGQISLLDTLEITGDYYDGTGLMMFARMHAGSDTTVSLRTIMEHRMGTTTISFSPRGETVSVAGIDRPVVGLPFWGTTDWKGSAFAGMSGAFRGWVSTDPRRLVLRAEVKIFLGSAVLELERIVQ